MNYIEAFIILNNHYDNLNDYELSQNDLRNLERLTIEFNDSLNDLEGKEGEEKEFLELESFQAFRKLQDFIDFLRDIKGFTGISNYKF